MKGQMPLQRRPRKPSCAFHLGVPGELCPTCRFYLCSDCRIKHDRIAAKHEELGADNAITTIAPREVPQPPFPYRSADIKI